MEKVKKADKHPHKYGEDFMLRILSLIIAIIIWFVLSITQYPTITKTVTKVPVTFSLDGTVAQAKGLSPINYNDIQVNVEIKGMNYEIGNYTNNDLTATVNLNKVRAEGKYELDIDVKSIHSTDKCTIVSVSPQTISVDFDRVSAKTLPLGVEAKSVRAKDGFTLSDQGTNISPGEITIKGAKNDVDTVDKAVVQISKSMVISEDTVINTDQVLFYDADDNLIDSSKFDIEGETSFDVDFSIYKKKTAKLSVDITDCPDNFDPSTLPIRFSTEEIAVNSPNLNDSNTEDIEVGSISLSSIDLTNHLYYDVKLGEGEININGIDRVAVTFDDKGYTYKDFTLPKKQIRTVNKPKGRSVKVETSKLTKVRIYGPKAVIAKLKASDIYASADLSDAQVKGSYTKNAMIYVPKYNNVWCYGVSEVQVKVN